MMAGPYNYCNAYFSLLGHIENSRDYSAIPGSTQPAWSDLSIIAVFWYIAGVQSVEQV